jgi:hypothetical protein
MVAAVDRGEVGALMLLDRSAAFDTTEHRIMLEVLQQCSDVRDAALDWFTSYFVDRTQVVIIGEDSSFVGELRIGAPQGSCLNRDPLSPTLRTSPRFSSSTTRRSLSKESHLRQSLA